MGSDNTSLVAKLLDGYLAGLAEGTPPSPEALLAEHPEAAEAINACLASLNWIKEAADQEPSPAAENHAEADHDASSTLGDFRLLREIGRGGMGVVYEAEQLSLGRRVALKVLPFAGMLDPRQRQRFLNEAHAAAQLNHPNIIDVISVGCQRGVHYYAMRLVDGPTLADVVTVLRSEQPDAEVRAYSSPHAPREGNHHAERDAYGTLQVQEPAELKGVTGFRHPAGIRGSGREDEGGLENAEAGGSETLTAPVYEKAKKKGAESSKTTPPIAGLSTSSPREYFRSIARLIVDVAQALDYAHQSGVIHRDIKPSNLIIDAQAKVWITDFGLARLEANPELTMTGDLIGTLRYMSPEQISGSRSAVDHRTDLYSLGATLYELLTLRPAFAGRNRTDLLRRIAGEPPRSPRKLLKSLPVELETIVLKTLEKNPHDRYRTGGELADDLQRFLDHRPIRARRSRVVAHAKSLWRRHQVLMVAVLTTLLLASSVGSVLVWQQWRQAVEQRALVLARDADMRQRLYATDMKLAQQAWQRGDAAAARALLDRYADPAREELRGFAWRYLDGLLRAAPKPLAVLRPGHGNIYHAQFSPDGSLLAAACGDGHVQLWNVADWTPRPALLAHQADADCVAFSPDGRLLATGGEDSTLRLWNVATGEAVRSWPAGVKDTLTMAISPDGQTLISGDIDGMVRLWALPGGEPRGEFRATSGRVQHLAFSLDGSRLATAGGEGVARVWNLSTLERVVELPFARAVYGVAFSPDAHTLAVGAGEGVVGLANVSQAAFEAFLGQRTSQTRSVAFSRTGRLLASAGENGVVELWHPATRSLLAMLSGHGNRIWCVTFSPDGRLLASAGDDGSIHIWDPVIEPGVVQAAPSEAIYGLRFASDGRQLLTSTDSQVLIAWSPQTLERIADFPLGGSQHRLAVSHDRRRVAIGNTGGDVWLGDAASGEFRPVDTGKNVAIRAIALMGEDRLVISYTDKTLDVWNPASSERIHRLEEAQLLDSCQAMSRDGRLVALDRADKFVLYDLDTLSARFERSSESFGSGLGLQAAAISPDGRLAAVGVDGAAIALFDVSSGEQVGELAGHQLMPEALAFSPDGRTLASAGRDGTVRLWHVATRQELFVLRRLDAGRFVDIDFSPDGRSLAAVASVPDGHRLFVWSTEASHP